MESAKKITVKDPKTAWMTGFAQILDGLQVLCGCGKGRNGSGIKWLADRIEL